MRTSPALRAARRTPRSGRVHSTGDSSKGSADFLTAFIKGQPKGWPFSLYDRLALHEPGHGPGPHCLPAKAGTTSLLRGSSPFVVPASAGGRLKNRAEVHGPDACE